MNDYYGYVPILKGKGFLPVPIAKYGIPYEADSSVNPKAEGTSAHEQFWEEQISYCINGYWSAGIYIPGRYYYYLNFCYISTLIRGNHHPDFVDADLEYFKLVDEAKRVHKGIISLKARRRGLSEKFAKAIVSYGLRFTPEGYKAGICAGLQTHADGLFEKVNMGNNLLPQELQMHELTNNSEELKMGYQELTTTGYKERGSMNTVICKTMNNNSAVLKGNLFNDVCFEEAGEFQLLAEGIEDTEDCFRVGGKKVGTPYVQGTGGNIKAASKAFQELWHDAADNDLLQYRVYSPRLYTECFIGSVNEENQIIDDCPNIKKMYPKETYSYEQLLGMEDVWRADERIEEEIKKLKKRPTKKKLFKYLQNNARNDREAFRKFTGNPFDADILSAVMHNILVGETRGYERFHLEFKRNVDGIIEHPLKIDSSGVIKAADDEEDRDCILIRHHPKPNYRDLDVAGIDSYDVDQAVSSKSLGAMVILRRTDKELPAFIRQRPVRKETFYENCLKLSVYFNLVSDKNSGNVLIDYAKPGIIKFFKDHGGKKYLAVRPRSFESEESQQSHDFGVLLVKGPRSKTQAIGTLQAYILDYGDKIPYPDLVGELQDYDVDQKDSDWDGADALMIALVRDADMKNQPRDRTAPQSNIDPFALPVYQEGPGGILTLKNNKLLTHPNGKPITDPFTKWMIEHGY